MQSNVHKKIFTNFQNFNSQNQCVVDVEHIFDSSFIDFKFLIANFTFHDDTQHMFENFVEISHMFENVVEIQHIFENFVEIRFAIENVVEI